MSETEQKESYIELFDVSRDKPIAKAPLVAISHLPRADERIFLRLPISGNWAAYTVLRIEYFLAGVPSASEGPLESPGMVRITLYVEPSK